MEAVAPGPIPGARQFGVHRVEWIAIASLLFACNGHLLANTFPTGTALLPDRVVLGEVWRLLTHAFAHVSWYHLTIDAAAFVFLYQSLGRWTWSRRVVGTLATIAGSALLSLTDPRLNAIGLCGLSGSAHGLMALVALGGLNSRDLHSRRLNAIMLTAVVVKCMAETIMGGAMFAHWHLGSVGVPIVACHSGGVIGALVFWLATEIRQRQRGVAATA